MRQKLSLCFELSYCNVLICWCLLGQADPFCYSSSELWIKNDIWIDFWVIIKEDSSLRVPKRLSWCLGGAWWRYWGGGHLSHRSLLDLANLAAIPNPYNLPKFFASKIIFRLENKKKHFRKVWFRGLRLFFVTKENAQPLKVTESSLFRESPFQIIIIRTEKSTKTENRVKSKTWLSSSNRPQYVSQSKINDARIRN